MFRIFFISMTCVFLFAAATPAAAQELYATTKINLRAGPDGGYPVVDIVRRGEMVDLLGCIRGLQWCEVETQSGEHGWIYTRYLEDRNGRSVTVIENNYGGTNIVIFRPNYYWDRNYRNKYFYKDRYRWIPRDSSHHHDDNDWNDDDNDHHGHHGGRPPVVQKPVEEPKYKPTPTPSRKKYNPLCPMGVSDC